ncbi:MAG: zinc ABC transporter substrate-binding protein [Desulfovibrionaceae bacterium]|nr:zinc ABC transporter substrate-binding protein [Desulfovibrionaceae bacterium]
MKKLLLALAALLLAAPAMAADLNVTVSIAPLKFFVDRIGGDRVRSEVMVPPGASPASYEPRPRQMVRLDQSAIFFAIGVPFERAWLPRMQSANPDIAVVQADAGIERMSMAAHHHHDEGVHHHDEAGEHHHDEADHHHGHGEAGEADHQGPLDPHVWNAPSLCVKMAGNILAALVAADPEGEAAYKANYESLLARIREVDGRIREMLHGLSGSRFLVYHPSWGYFARDYGLIQVPVELEGKEPGPKELASVIALAREENIRAIFAQPQFSSKSAATIARAIGGEVVVADPLAARWDENLLQVAARFAEALK